MNKKKLITMVTSLALVAVIGIGATLAYMTSATEEKKNTFTIGHIEAGLEEKTDEDKDWNDETDGKNMYPGQSVVKKPVMTIREDSADSYAFLKVSGADALVANGFIITAGIEKENIDVNTASAFNKKDWLKVDGDEDTLDGVYRYIGAAASKTNAEGMKVIPKSDEDTVLEDPIFDLVTYRTDKEGSAETEAAGEITVVGCAVQAEGLTAEEAFAQAVFEAN